jgi:hypothetical protein
MLTDLLFRIRAIAQKKQLEEEMENELRFHLEQQSAKYRAMGLEPGYDREREFDASVTRVRRHTQNAGALRAHALELAQGFSSREQRRTVYDLLKDLVGSDNQVSAEENRLLSVVREVFQL